jgi:hypothetical protein
MHQSGKVHYVDPASRNAALIALGALQALLFCLRNARYRATIYGEIERLEGVVSRIATLENQIRQLEEDLDL